MKQKKAEKFEQLIEQLASLSEMLGSSIPSDTSEIRKKRARVAMARVYEAIRSVADGLDPVSRPRFVFDPTDPSVAARIAGIALIAQPKKPLASIEKSYGAGVYAIYYRGDFKPYSLISGKEHPVYVGKADPAGERSRSAIDQGVQLEKRLHEHRKTIASAKESLRIEDFEYRALVVRSGWEDSTEKHLIKLFRPIWNKQTNLCPGFGKHGDSSKTRAHPNSAWDVLHAGRNWASNNTTKDKKSAEQISVAIEAHFAANPPIQSVDDALRQLLAEMQATTD